MPVKPGAATFWIAERQFSNASIFDSLLANFIGIIFATTRIQSVTYPAPAVVRQSLHRKTPYRLFR